MSRRDVDQEMRDIRVETSTIRLNLGPLPVYRPPPVESNPSTPLPLTPIPLDQLGSIRYANLYPPSGTDSLSTRSSSSSSSSSGLIPPQIVGSKRRRALVDDGDTLSTESSDDTDFTGGSWGVGGSADRGLKARSSEGTWEEMDDFVLQSFLLHPLQPLSHPYPPGTLPDPPGLDELTNQIMHYESLEHRSPRSQARAYSARLRERSSSSRTNRASDLTSENTMADEDEDMASKGKRRWMHTWKQTRARLAHVARLVSKGYNTEEISRALGHVSSELADECAVSGDAGLVIAAAKPSKIIADIGPFKVGGIGPTARSRPSRPHMRRISSMDFLDAPEVAAEVTDVPERDSLGDTISPERPQVVEAGLGRVLRLSTTLQNSSQNAEMPPPFPSLLPLGSPLDVPNNTLLSPPNAVTAPITRSTSIPNPRRSLRRRASTKMSSGGVARPTSLLQRGRSFTASDLSKEVEEMRDNMAATRKADDVQMKSVMEAGEPNELMDVDTTANTFVTPVKKQPTAVGMRGAPATDSTTSDSDSPLSPTSTTSPSPFKPVSSSVQPLPATDFRFSAAQRPKRANSSITAAEYHNTPHGLQQLFIAPVKPSTTDRSQLLAPLTLGSASVRSPSKDNTSPKILINGDEESDKEDDEVLMVRRKKGKPSGSAERDSGRSGMKFGGVLGGTKAEVERLGTLFKEGS